MAHTVFRTCTLCEAACGLAFDVEGERIVAVRGDDDDVLSAGFVCPKGIAIEDVHHDPDRLRHPMRRTASGDFEPCSWDDAFELVASRLRAIRGAHGPNAVAVYMGNPIVHNHGALLLRTPLLRALGTKSSFSAGSQDTSPRFATSYHLYGSSLVVPIPDVDRTQYFLCIRAGRPRGSGGRNSRSARWQRVAGAHAGVSINDWTDDQLVERVVGQSILNGVPVRRRIDAMGAA